MTGKGKRLNADEQKSDEKKAQSSKRKRVGDETPNPLPDADYTADQPAGDDNPAEATDSAVG